MLQAVVETMSFRHSAAKAGMSEAEVMALIDFLAANPEAGEEIVGTGGCRKIRVAGRGKGKSGGYRVITFFSGAAMPLFLVYAYAKSDQADLDGSERTYLKQLTKALIAGYRKGLRSV